MAMPQPSDDELARLVAALDAAQGVLSHAAKALELPDTTARRWRDMAARRGMLGTKPILPGFEISRASAELDEAGNVHRQWVTQKPERGGPFTLPEGHVVKGVSALLDADGRVAAQWVKTREGIEPLDVVEALKSGLESYSGPKKPSAAPRGCNDDLLTLLPLADWHLGLYTWRREVGENWDLNIAEQLYTETIEDLMSRTPRAGTAIVLGGGDLVHSDNFDNRTARSGNSLDVDGRYPKVVETAGRMVVRTVDTCLRTHAHVVARILPGNHDEHTSVAIAYFLSAWFRHEPRVTVDTDPSLFFWHRFGKVFLGATHGHTVKARQMPAIMAARRPEDWGASRFRHIHCFHVHHTEKLADEAGGATVHVHRSPAPQDAWHFGAGFVSGRSMETTTYHRSKGEHGSSFSPVRSHDDLSVTEVPA